MTFSEIPSNNLVPMFMTEFDNSNAVKSGAMPWKNLIIGQALSDHTAFNGRLVQIMSDAEIDAKYGDGSQIALMLKAFRKNSKNSELWALSLGDGETSAVAASCTVTASVSGSDSEPKLPFAGTIRLMIGGQSVPVIVAANDTASGVGAKIAAAINAKTSLPVTASNSSGAVTITAKCKGECGNGIDIRWNHFSGEELPEALSLTLSSGGMKSGAGDTSYENATIASIIEGTWFNAIVAGSSTAENVGYIKDILDERWTATVQQTGVLFFSLNANSESAFTARGNSSSEPAMNSAVVCMPALPKTPTTGYEVAAAVLGCVAPLALNDPASPLSNYVVKGIVAPKPEDREGLNGNNALLRAGCALLTCGASGEVMLKRIVTTYKRTASGAADTSYQQVETVFTLSFIRWDWNNYMAGRYPHAKLADDGNDFGPGQTIMTPNLGKGELLGRYEYWMSKGLVMNYDSFKENLVVVRDEDDNTALCFLIPAELISQFFIGKSKIQFSF